MLNIRLARTYDLMPGQFDCALFMVMADACCTERLPHARQRVPLRAHRWTGLAGGAIEITCNQVNFLRNQTGTKSLDELLGDAFLLGVDVADMQRQHSKELLTTDCGSTK